MESEGVERKLAAILSADVVGYSRLMAEDEQGTIRTLGVYREQIGVLVREHRGRVVDFTGDNFLAEFPTALDAVQCAVEIQGVLKARNAQLPTDHRMEFRIGMNLGDISVEGERIYGDGVNIAARLEGLAEAGGICISATVHEQVRNKLDVDFTDLGDQTVKNIPDQVHVFQIRLESMPRKPEHFGRTRGAQRRGLRTALLATSAAILLLGVGLWASWPRPLGWVIDLVGLAGPPENPPLPQGASIVVLPFTNMSGDPEQEYFSDGITEDLTTDLASSSEMFVISRSSAFMYKDKAVKAKDVGRELGVRYVLEGSVRKAGDQVRITAQLIDATTGFHIWSDRYDRDLADIFALQSEISEEIRAAVGVEVTEAEMQRSRAKPTDDLTAYDSLMRAIYHLNRFSKEDNLEARRWGEKAIQDDPSYSAAYALIGGTYALETGFGWNLDPTNLDRAENYARRAVELRPEMANGYLTLASVALFRNELEEAARAASRAIELAPSNEIGHFFMGLAEARQGNFLSATQSIKRALRLNPRADTGYKSIVGFVNFAAGRREEGVAVWERLRAANPDLIIARIPLATYYEEVGRHAEARAIAREILRVNPDFTAEAAINITGGLLFGDDADRLRAAGLP